MDKLQFLVLIAIIGLLWNEKPWICFSHKGISAKLILCPEKNIIMVYSG